jgi:hypothetical protein
MKYARDGYRFYRVSTPSMFSEFELPVNDEQMTEKEKRQLQLLENLARIDQTHIECSPYRSKPHPSVDDIKWIRTVQSSDCPKSIKPKG